MSNLGAFLGLILSIVFDVAAAIMITFGLMEMGCPWLLALGLGYVTLVMLRQMQILTGVGWRVYLRPKE